MNIIKRMLYSVAFIFSVALLCPFRVNAQFMPPAPPDLNTINLPGFLMDVFSTQMVQDMGVNVSSNQLDVLNQIANGRTVASSLNDSYVDNATIQSPLQTFYNSNGDVVAQADSYTVLGTSDLCNYAYVCDKRTGEILWSYNEYNEMVSTLTAGNMRYPSIFPDTNTRQQQNIRNDINRAVDENLIVFANNLTDEEMETLASYDYYMTYTSNALGYTVYVPNACTKDTVVTPYRVNNLYSFTGTVEPNSQVSQLTPIIRSNNPSEVYYSTNGNNNYMISESNTAYGYNFGFISSVNVGYAPLWNGGYLDMHLPTQSEYQQYRELSHGSVYLQPAQNNGEVTNEYNYTNVTNNYTRPSPIINHNYDNRQDTNYYNYPVTNNVTYPDYSETTNNYYETIYNYYTMPKVDEELEADPELIGNNIPILSNLQNRFPFSIPWDIARIFDSLSVEREAPVIDAEIYFPIIDYTWNCSIDLSMFEDVAEIVRKCILILFIVGLAVFSYSHHFGS